MGGLMNALEAARTYHLQFFTPSSIGAFASTPKVNTPQVTIQQPTTMYGVNKVAGELLCQYYFVKFGVDTRSVRFWTYFTCERAWRRYNRLCSRNIL